MSLINNEKFKNFFIEFENTSVNKFSKEQTVGFLTDSAMKFDSKVVRKRLSKNIVRSDIIYNNCIVGYLNGVRPSSTENEAVSFSKENNTVIEYLKLQNIDFSEDIKDFFRIRITIIEGIYSAASLILPPFIVGNGKDTLVELVKKKNEIRKTISLFKKSLIEFDDEVNRELKKNNLSKDTILEKDEVYILKREFAIKNGSETMDVTNLINDQIVAKAISTIASVPGLYTAGVEFNIDDLFKPLKVGFVSLIVSPGLIIHYLPYKGEAVKLYDVYIQSLLVRYKKGKNKELSESELSLQKDMDKFFELKIKYINYIVDNDFQSKNISEDLKDNLNIFKHKELTKQNQEFSDLVKKNVIVNKEIFKPIDNNELIKVTKSNLLRLVKSRNDSSEIAVKALNNEIIPFPGFESVTFDESYYYTDKSEIYGPSYQLYIQTLRIAAVLLVEYEKNKDISYFYKAEEIIYEWISYVSKGTEERMVWYDHPTSNRVQVLIHYLYLAQELEIDVDNMLFRAILLKHGEVLSNDAIYINNNHGLMMDKALIVLGNVLDNEKLFIKGFYRSVDTFWYSFSSKGTHLENSPQYHNMVVRMYDELQKYLEKNKQTYSKNILGYLNIAKEYLNIIIKPNSYLPSIGDSDNILRKLKKSYENFYDEEAGLGILQYNSEKPFYLNFICGYSSKTHKHEDDLSINLNYNGEDFLTDAGKFNYNGKSPLRKYVISKNAHSSFQLKDYNYELSNTNRFDRKIKLNGYNFTDNVSMIKGYHAGYDAEEVVLNRALFQIKDKPIVIIYDFINNKNEIKYNFIQNFNLSKNISIEKTRKLYELNGKKEKLVIKQLLKTNKQEVVHGDENVPVAVNTIGFSKVEESSQIKYYQNTRKKDVFLTAIYDNTVIKEVNLISLDSTIVLTINNQQFTFNI